MRARRTGDLGPTALAVCLFAFVLSLIAPVPAMAGVNDYPSQWANASPDSLIDDWGYYSRECTSFVAWRLHSRNGFEMPHAIGNADAWGGWASSHGYTVNGTPTVGSVAWLSSGHVAWVEAVSGSSVTVEEYNWNFNHNYNERIVPASSFTGYVHFKDIVSGGGGGGHAGHAQGDFDGDGKSDIAWYDGHNILGMLSAGGAPLNHWQYMAGLAVGQADIGTPGWAGVGDFDGDGKADVAWYDGHNILGMLSAGGAPLNHWQYMAGPAVGQADIGRPLWAGVGDFDGDGKADVVWYDGHNILGMLSAGGAPLNHWQYLAGPAVGQADITSPGWAGVGDFDGDGKADVVWYDGHNILGMLSAGGAPLNHWQYMAGPAVGQADITSPGWAGTGSFPSTNGGNILALAPAVVTEAASAITPTSATLNATVNPEGGEVSDCRFEYGTSPAYGSSLPCASLPGWGTSPVGVSAPAARLSANALLHFRVVATNPVGTSYGADRTFTTLPSGPPPIIIKTSPKGGSATGGTSVTITGSNFTAATAVTFGSGPATSFVVNSATSITAVSPPAATGTVDLTVTTGGGTSTTTSRDHFKYGPPAVSGVGPNSGSRAGGTTVTVTGSGFALGAGTTLKFGKTTGTSANCTSTTTCTVIVPASTKAGSVDVIAAIGKAKSKKSPPGDQYAYH